MVVVYLPSLQNRNEWHIGCLRTQMQKVFNGQVLMSSDRAASPGELEQADRTTLDYCRFTHPVLRTAIDHASGLLRVAATVNVFGHRSAPATVLL